MNCAMEWRARRRGAGVAAMQKIRTATGPGVTECYIFVSGRARHLKRNLFSGSDQMWELSSLGETAKAVGQAISRLAVLPSSQPR